MKNKHKKGEKVVFQAQEPAVFAGIHYGRGEELEITLIRDVDFDEEGIGEGGPWGWGGFTSEFLEEISGENLAGLDDPLLCDLSPEMLEKLRDKPIKSYSIHVCVHDPRNDPDFDGVDDQGWLDIDWPADVQEAMSDSWFGFEENCWRNYCARIDFETEIPMSKMIDKLESIKGITNAEPY